MFNRRKATKRSLKGLEAILLFGGIVMFLMGFWTITGTIYQMGTPAEINESNVEEVDYSVEKIGIENIRGEYVSYSSLEGKQKEIADKSITDGNIVVSNVSDLPHNETHTLIKDGQTYEMRIDITESNDENDYDGDGLLYGLLLFVGTFLSFSIGEVVCREHQKMNEAEEI